MATCTVSGTLLDPSETAISGATVLFKIQTPVLNPSFLLIGPEQISTTTAADGTWSLSISQQVTGILTIQIPSSSTTPKVAYNFALQIPSQATATFAQVWVDSQNVTSQTFPINFSLILGTLATAQLPALSSGQVWVGNASNLATGVSLTGDVSLTSAGLAKVLALQGTPVSATAPTNGQLLAYNLSNAQWEPTTISSNGITQLTGDVTAGPGSGSQASTVVSVGGSSAAHVHSAELLANAATASATPSTIALRDGSGNLTATNLSGTNTGDVSLTAVGSAPAAAGASLSGQAITLQPADGTHPGVLTSGAQTIGGAKTFSGAITASNLSGTNTGDQTITLTGDVAGSGTGSFAATIQAGAVDNSKVSATAAIAYSKLATLASGNILVGSNTSVATSVAMSGDVTIGNTGVTAIGTNKVANSQLAQMGAHTFKGNNTGSTANASDLTATQLTAELNALVGDSGSGGTKGLAPAPSSGDAASGKFLKADATWAVPASGGISNYYSGSFASASAWTTTSASFADATNSNGNTLTSRFSSGLTVTAGASNVCGITWTPSVSTAIYYVKATFQAQGTTGGAAAAFRLTDGSLVVSTASNKPDNAGMTNMVILDGIYAPGTGSAITLKVQFAAIGGGTTILTDISGGLAAAVEWTVIQLK